MVDLRGQVVTPGRFVGPAHWYAPGENLPPDSVILVRGAVSAEIVLQLRTTRAVASSGGGRSSHASILMRQFDVPCLVGVGALDTIVEGTMLELDAFSGVLRVIA